LLKTGIKRITFNFFLFFLL